MTSLIDRLRKLQRGRAPMGIKLHELAQQSADALALAERLLCDPRLHIIATAHAERWNENRLAWLRLIDGEQSKEV